MPPATGRVPRRRGNEYPRGEFRCELCTNCNLIFTRNSAAFQEHLEDINHKYNYLLHAFKTKRNRKAQNRHGVEIKTTCDSQTVIEYGNDGTVKSVVIGQPKEVIYKFKVANKSDIPIKLCDVFLLHPYPVFKILEGENFQATNKRLEIMPGASCVFSVHFNSETLGSYGVPVVFSFLKPNEKKKERHFHVIRMMVINVVGSEHTPHIRNENSPYKGDEWPGMCPPIPGMTENGKRLRHITGFELERMHFELFENWLNPWPRMPDEATLLVSHVTTVEREGYKSLKDHYVPFFHTLLHLEEHDSADALRHYNMSGVNLEQLHPGVFKLEVPGMAEKRPSVLRGDLIYVRVHYPDGLRLHFPYGVIDEIQYEGRVTGIHEPFVHLSCFNLEFLRRFNYEPDLKFDVRFALPRFPFVVMHRAVDLVAENNLMDVLFPSNNQPQPALIHNNTRFQFFNPDISSNKEQELAVKNIVSGVCRPSPYIIFGPPGTGKTVTVVEAILQVKKLFHDSHILVCAPSNAACDFLTGKLTKGCNPSELLRMHSTSRDMKLVPAAIRKFNNLRGNDFYIPSADQIVKHRIVICTLVTASRFVNLLTGKRKHHFTHIFIDECGQALEPEAIAAIGGILGQVKKNKIGGQLILAGDPKQLGPVCVSKRAETILPPKERQGRDSYPNELAFLNSKVGLGVSLLERLMITCDLYTKNDDGLYDSRYTTKLLFNYRSHPAILKLPNKLFYDNELKIKCSDSIKNDPLFELPLIGKKKKKAQPVIFHGVLGHERGEGCSPSFYNLYEIKQVMQYLEKLLSSGIVKQTEIGIIAPYIRQVYKLKNRLEEKQWNEIEVGTTEVFQGREKRVIIISTVRSNRDLLDIDKKFQIGFLSDEKRFNVAITRAQSLLIVIGSPFMIGSDDNWNELIEYTRKELKSYAGCHYQKRDHQWKHQVVENVTRLNEIGE